MKKAYTATDTILMAKAQKVKSTLLQKFRDGQELREYRVNIDSQIIVSKIKALPQDHF